VTVGPDPVALAYDASLGAVAVARGSGSSITYVNDTTNTVVAAGSVPAGPEALVDDPFDGAVVAACSPNGTVVELLRGVVVAELTLGGSLGGLFVDPTTGDLWVADDSRSGIDVRSFG
jgi:DNA-binding beta-propeller fold protein YncE